MALGRPAQNGQRAVGAGAQAVRRWEMSDLIELVCAAHLERSKSDSLVTAVEGGHWAFCAAGAPDGHDWRQIEPTAVGSVRNRPPRGLRELLSQERENSPETA
jgi:hypothetical protein